MSKFQIIKGNLINLALNCEFDVITHGCNCQSIMGGGIAPLMAKQFACDKFLLEGDSYKGIDKLGRIDIGHTYIKEEDIKTYDTAVVKRWNIEEGYHLLRVINSYTQEYPGIPNKKYNIPLDYDALTLCMRKINSKFKGLKIGLPWIGCGLAKGDRNKVREIIEFELSDMDITIIEL